jgi:hypothetical protein
LAACFVMIHTRSRAHLPTTSCYTQSSLQAPMYLVCVAKSHLHSCCSLALTARVCWRMHSLHADGVWRAAACGHAPDACAVPHPARPASLPGGPFQ